MNDHSCGSIALEAAEPSLLVAESAIDLAARGGAIVERAEFAPPPLHTRWKRILEAALERDDDAVRAAAVRSSTLASTGPALAPLL